MAPTTRATWTSCIVSTVFALVCYLVVLKTEEKSFVILWTILGTVLLFTAIRECPIRLASQISLVNGVLALVLAGLLVIRGLGYYNHTLKIMIVVSLCGMAAYFFSVYFSRLRATSQKSD